MCTQECTHRHRAHFRLAHRADCLVPHRLLDTAPAAPRRPRQLGAGTGQFTGQGSARTGQRQPATANTQPSPAPASHAKVVAAGQPCHGWRHEAQAAGRGVGRQQGNLGSNAGTAAAAATVPSPPPPPVAAATVPSPPPPPVAAATAPPAARTISSSSAPAPGSPDAAARPPSRQALEHDF